MKKPAEATLTTQRTNGAKLLGAIIALLAVFAVIPFRDTITGWSSSEGTFWVLAAGYGVLATFIIGLRISTRRTKSSASIVSTRTDNPAIVWIGVPIVILLIAVGAWSVAG